MGHPDTSGKKVINIYSQAWAEWVLRDYEVKVEAELSGEFQFIARKSDSLLKVTGSNGTFLVLTELQFLHDTHMPLRLAAYKLLAEQQYGLEVFVTVVYFLPPPPGKTINTTYHRNFMGQLTQVDFQVIKLWELSAEQLMVYNNPALLPFIPLMQGGDTEQMVRSCATRLRAEPHSAELQSILAIFASRVLNLELVRQIVRWEMDMIQESPLIQELSQIWLERGIEKGIERGIKRGIAKGERQATIKALNLALAIRFGAPLGQFDELWLPFNVADLQKLNELALTATSLADFLDTLQAMPPTPETETLP